MNRIGVIGGGASGLMAAITAARRQNTEVFILEHKEQAGKKLLSTGNGRFNLTNEKMYTSFFRSEETKYVEEVLKQFGSHEAITFFEGLGLMVRSRNGYIYPRCEQASVVRGLLVREAEESGVRIHTGVHVTEIIPGKKGFQIQGEHADKTARRKERYYAHKVILACGGRAASVLGSDGSGYTLAKSLGHSLVPVVPALVQLKVKDHPLKNAAGVRTEASVSALVDGTEVSADTGELQITNYGISGIPVFQISRYLAKALYQKRRAEAVIDFLPAMSEAELTEYLQKRSMKERRKVSEYLTGIFHEKLTLCLLSLSGISPKKQAKELSGDEIRRFVRQCRHTVLLIQDTNGFDNAQVCAGGVRLQEACCRTMESRYVEGLYLTGELLDVDGMCGGYNLQWAWATGWLAGNAAAK